MKVNEYLPLYGLLTNFEYFIGIDINGRSRKITVKTLFDKCPEYELGEARLMILDSFDIISLQKALKDSYFNEHNTIPYLRELFDEYRMNGGDPKIWLTRTIETITMNPQNYKPEVRGIIESTLTQWNELYFKNLDVLYLNTKDPDKARIQPSIVGYFCYLAKEALLIPVNNLSNVAFCNKVCEKLEFNYTGTVNNYFSKPGQDEINKIKNQIFPLLNENERNQIEKYISSMKIHA